MDDGIIGRQWRELEIDVERSLINRIKWTGANMKPWRHEHSRRTGETELHRPVQRWSVCWENMVFTTQCNQNKDDFYDKILCQTRSKILEMSREYWWFSPWLSSTADQECERTVSKSSLEQRVSYSLVVAQHIFTCEECPQLIGDNDFKDFPNYTSVDDRTIIGGMRRVAEIW